MKRRQFLKALGIGLLSPATLAALPEKKAPIKFKPNPAQEQIMKDNLLSRGGIIGLAAEDIPKNRWGWIMVRSGPYCLDKGLPWTQEQKYPLGTLLRTPSGEMVWYGKFKKGVKWQKVKQKQTAAGLSVV